MLTESKAKMQVLSGMFCQSSEKISTNNAQQVIRQTGLASDMILTKTTGHQWLIRAGYLL